MSVPITHQTDLELFAQLSGEKSSAEAAFAILYQRFAPRVFAYCRRILGDYERAQDAFQESFIKFYNAARHERPMTNVAAFLLRIARNTCLNYQRLKPGLSQPPVQFVDDYHAPNDPYSYENQELLKLVTMALELLPENYREVFVLREYDGLSYAEIAEITNTSTANVKVRIFRAKQQIREILAPYLEDLSKI